MEPCSLCHLNLDRTRPEVSLLCNHNFHTTCLFNEMIDIYHTMGDSCPICQTRFFTIDPAVLQVRRLEKKEADNLKMYKRFTDANGSIADLKCMKKQLRILRKKKSTFFKLARAKKRQFREEASAINQILKDMQKKYKNQLNESNEYKELLGARRNFSKHMNRFNRKYAADHITFQDACGVSQLKMPIWWSIASDLRAYSWRLARLFRLW
jgi:hypothetical protein